LHLVLDPRVHSPRIWNCRHNCLPFSVGVSLLLRPVSRKHSLSVLTNFSRFYVYKCTDRLWSVNFCDSRHQFFSSIKDKS
jgi:hypothetical protein